MVAGPIDSRKVVRAYAGRTVGHQALRLCQSLLGPQSDIRREQVARLAWTIAKVMIDLLPQLLHAAEEGRRGGVAVAATGHLYLNIRWRLS